MFFSHVDGVLFGDKGSIFCTILVDQIIILSPPRLFMLSNNYKMGSAPKDQLYVTKHNGLFVVMFEKKKYEGERFSQVQPVNFLMRPM